MKIIMHPYSLLVLTCWMWAGNAVASKLALGHISPLALTTLRWVISCALMLFIARNHLKADWVILRHHKKLMFLYGALGFTIFNVFMYMAANFTTSVNISILQGSVPLWVLGGTVLLYKAKTTRLQWGGIFITMLGILVLASKGDLASLKTFQVNSGDLLMLFACFSYAIYTILLKNRPKVHGLSFFTIAAFAALIFSIPLLGVEYSLGKTIFPHDTMGFGILLYVALFPSLLSQLTFLWAVDKIGPGRAGIFVNLMPVFGPILAVLILGEHFGGYHFLALALVLCGVALAELGKPKS
jgi:drug/metabolite transporter (DMT)-like permease